MFFFSFDPAVGSHLCLSRKGVWFERFLTLSRWAQLWKAWHRKKMVHLLFNRCFSIICPGAIRATFSLLCGCYALGHKASAYSTVCESSRDYVVRARFSDWSSISGFFLLLRRPRYALSRPLFYFCEQIGGTNVNKQTIEEKVRSKTMLFPAKTTPSSAAGCLVRISGSTVVCSDRFPLWIEYPPWSAVDWETGNSTAIVLAWEQAVWGKKQYVG